MCCLSARNMVDLDHDGKINVSEFCTAMHLIRQAQQQEGGLLGSSQGVGFFQQGMGARQPSASLGPRQQSSGLVSVLFHYALCLGLLTPTFVACRNLNAVSNRSWGQKLGYEGSELVLKLIHAQVHSHHTHTHTCSSALLPPRKSPSRGHYLQPSPSRLLLP